MYFEITIFTGGIFSNITALMKKIRKKQLIFRERFKGKGMFENELYSNIPFLLKSLKELNYILVVAT